MVNDSAFSSLHCFGMLTQQLSCGVLASSALIFLKKFFEGQMQHGITHDLGKEGQLNKQ